MTSQAVTRGWLESFRDDAPLLDAGVFRGADWTLLGAIVAFAALLRMAFFTGFFGSDEVTYVEAAIAAANGVWPNSTYIGALRFGVNYPIAAAIGLFGTSQVAVSIWSVLCSVLEVGVVYWFGHRTGGRSLALAASFLLALLPLHVHLAGRIMADAPLALFMSLTFICFYEGEARNSRAFYLLAGTCAGLVFWIKEVPTIFVGTFVVWAIVRRRVTTGWLWAAAALAAVVAANFALMWVLSGNPLHLTDSIRIQMGKYSARPTETDSPTFAYYFRYLFADVWHTWLLGYLAAAGVAASLVLIGKASPRQLALKYILVWGLGLIGIFSFFVVSVSPLRLIPKQTNYMTIFLAPLCLLGGLAIVKLKSRLARAIVLSSYAVGALFLCALEQQVIHNFTANSRAALKYAASAPNDTVYVATNAYRLNRWATILSGTGSEPVLNVRPLDQLLSAPRTPAGAAQGAESARVLAIVDMETLDWGDNGLRSARDIPACWEKVSTLVAPADSTAGRLLTSLAARGAALLPGKLARPVVGKLDSQLAPLPAHVYRVPASCG